MRREHHRAASYALVTLGAIGALPALAGMLPNLPATCSPTWAVTCSPRPTRFVRPHQSGILAVLLTHGTYAVGMLGRLEWPRL